MGRGVDGEGCGGEMGRGRGVGWGGVWGGGDRC